MVHLKCVAYIWLERIVLQRLRQGNVSIKTWRRMRHVKMDMILSEECEYKIHTECKQEDDTIQDYELVMLVICLMNALNQNTVVCWM